MVYFGIPHKTSDSCLCNDPLFHTVHRPTLQSHNWRWEAIHWPRTNRYNWYHGLQWKTALYYWSHELRRSMWRGQINSDIFLASLSLLCVRFNYKIRFWTPFECLFRWRSGIESLAQNIWQPPSVDGICHMKLAVLAGDFQIFLLHCRQFRYAILPRYTWCLRNLTSSPGERFLITLTLFRHSVKRHSPQSSAKFVK